MRMLVVIMMMVMVMMEKEEEEGGRERKEDENGDAGDSAGGRVIVMVVTSPFTCRQRFWGTQGKGVTKNFMKSFVKMLYFSWCVGAYELHLSASAFLVFQ